MYRHATKHAPQLLEPETFEMNNYHYELKTTWPLYMPRLVSVYNIYMLVGNNITRTVRKRGKTHNTTRMQHSCLGDAVKIIFHAVAQRGRLLLLSGASFASTFTMKSSSRSSNRTRAAMLPLAWVAAIRPLTSWSAATTRRLSASSVSALQNPVSNCPCILAVFAGIAARAYLLRNRAIAS